MSNTKWITPFENLKIAAMAAIEDTLVVAGATDDAEVEIRAARWDGDRFTDFRRLDVPFPTDAGLLQPTLSLDRHGGRLALAIDLGDEQRGSCGLYVVPDIASATIEKVPKSAEDPEIDFAESVILRGDTLLTRGPWELRSYQRTRGQWTQRMALRAGDDSNIEWSWPIDLSPNGKTWIAARSSENSQLVFLERRNDSFAPAFELATDDGPMSLVFVGDDEALVASASTWRDGASLRYVRRTANGWAWGRTLDVTPEPNGNSVEQIAVCGGRAVITQRHAAWLMDLAEGVSVPIRLPPRASGDPSDPQVRIMGTHAVLRVDDQIRLMDLGA